jgi:transcriptional regulator MraZ
LWFVVEQKGLRGSSPARIDEKGRLKVPTMFRGVIQDQSGPDVFVTSLTGECVRIYPMQVWIEVERKLTQIPTSHPSRLKFLDRVNYYGQTGELDVQGRVVIPAHLRESASIVGDVRVFGRIDYLEVWNEELFAQKLRREAWTDDDGLRLSEHGI